MSNLILKIKIYALMAAIVLAPLALFVGLILLFVEANSQEGKYTIYAANKTYHTDNFQTAGQTIYFRDVHKKNVCITGQYTLIYEKELSEE